MMNQYSKYMAIGIMCGSSLDAIDLALCQFSTANGRWKWQCLRTESIPLNETFCSIVLAENPSFREIMSANARLGNWIGTEINRLNWGPVDVIGYHGPTITHAPEHGYSFQLGHGAQINVATTTPTVTDFRTADLALGGQGAPLVPFGEKHLFPGFTGYLNLGGIANLTRTEDWMAGDICPCNQVLNHYARNLGQPFDDEGKYSIQGTVNIELLRQWQQLPFFSLPFPKSMDNQWVRQHFLNLSTHPANAMKTLIELLVHNLQPYWPDKGEVLVTGGGAYNKHLIDNLEQRLVGASLLIPDKTSINYKEAIIFAFLAICRLLNIPNVLSTSTGAKKDSIAGLIHIHS